MSMNDPKNKTTDAPVIDEMAKDEEAEEKRVAEVQKIEKPIKDTKGNLSDQSIRTLASNLTQKAIDRLNDLIKDLRSEIDKGEIDIDSYKKRLKKAGNSLRRAGVALDVAGGDTGENAKEAAQDRWKKQKLFDDEVTYLRGQAQAARTSLEEARQSITENLPKNALQAIEDELDKASSDLAGPRSILAKVKGYVIPKVDQNFQNLHNREEEVGRVQTALDRAITETGDAVAYCDNNGDNPDFQEYTEHLDSAIYAIAEAKFALDTLIGPNKPADSKPAEPAKN
ncbi:MAG: hypothetical protein LUC43_09885 [Burkholderiales bacterium]|nr:hypothetical protein [Burkholderiales bacterium]